MRLLRPVGNMQCFSNNLRMLAFLKKNVSDRGGNQVKTRRVCETRMPWWQRSQNIAKSLRASVLHFDPAPSPEAWDVIEV